MSARQQNLRGRRQSRQFRPTMEQGLENRSLLSGTGTNTVGAAAFAVGINLPSTAYYSPAMTFNDAMKYASPWQVSKNGSWNEPNVTRPAVDENGYPLEVTSLTGQGYSLRTIPFLHDGRVFPEGNYTLTFDGAGTLILDGGASKVTVTQASGVHATYVVPVKRNDGGISVTFAADDPADHIRNVHLIMPGYQGTYQSNPFTKEFLNDLKPFGTLRFMDAMNTNNQQLTSWSQRSKPSDMSQSGLAGMAVEYMVQLANLTHEDPWFNMPAMADDNYIRNFSAYVRDHLDPGLKAYVEYSNETWNWSFPQYAYVHSQAVAAGKLDDQEVADLEAHAWGIWTDAFAGQTSRMVRVAASQAGYPARLDTQIAELVKDGAPGDANHGFDVVSGAPYYSWDTSHYTAATTTAQMVADAAASIEPTMKAAVDPFQQTVSKWGQALGRSIPSLAYEGGFGPIVPIEAPYYQAYLAVQHDPGMYAVTESYLAALKAHGLSGIDYFTLAGVPSRFGEWGTEVTLGEPANLAPKYAALADFAAAQTPDIEGLTVSRRAGDGFTASWSGLNQATARIDYGLTSKYGASAVIDSALATGHQLAVAGLLPGQTYHFRVTVTDKFGHQSVSQDQTTSTDVSPPAILGTPAIWYDGSSATITWVTNKPSTSFVAYGQGASAARAGDATPSTSHSVTLPGLAPGTAYRYHIESTDAAGNTTTTPDATYTTHAVTSRTILDDAGSGFHSSMAGLVPASGASGGTYHLGFAGASTNELADWTAQVAPGRYRVSVSWQHYGFHMGTVGYAVMNGDRVLASIDVDQNVTPNDFSDAGVGWKFLGDFAVTDGALKVVEYDRKSTMVSFVTADAVSLIPLATPPAPKLPAAPAITPATILDDTGPGFHSSSMAGLKPSNGASGGSYHLGFAGNSTNELADWTAQVAPGQYQVSVTWQHYGFHMGTVEYVVMDGDRVLASIDVDQNATPADSNNAGVGWKTLGNFNVTDGALKVVEYDRKSTMVSFVTADAVSLIPLARPRV